MDKLDLSLSDDELTELNRQLGDQRHALREQQLLLNAELSRRSDRREAARLLEQATPGVKAALSEQAGR